MRFALLVSLLLPLFSFADEPQRAGADWWSLQPLATHQPPLIVEAKHPIDAFILAKLREKQLTLAPEADRATLIRRLTFDLTGLPPTLAEIDAFLRDDKPFAYERLVDRLLASPRYGERYARHWLDVVRFGESDGFERDKLRDVAWPYRDYVIDAFNRDQPYGRFIREQIAGDAMPKATRDSMVATGMLVAGPFDEVAAATASQSVKLQARQDELEDMLAVVGQSFLGLTVNCARCHDHKFDPISALDYYRLQAVFVGVRPGTRELLSPFERQQRERGVQLANQRIAELTQSIARIEQRGRERVRPEANKDGPRPVARWSFDRDGQDGIGGAHATLHGEAKIEGGQLVVGGKGGFARTEPLPFALHGKTLEAWVSLATLDQRGGGVISVESPDGKLFDAIVFAEREPRKWMAGSNFFARTRDVEAMPESATPGERVHVAITYSADHRISIYRNGEHYGAAYSVPGANGVPSFPVKGARVLFGLRHTGGGNGQFHGAIHEARLYDRALSLEEIRASMRSTGIWVSPEQVRAALTLDESTELTRFEREVVELRGKLSAMQTVERAYIGIRTAPEPVHLLRRGDITKKGEIVTAGGLPMWRGPVADWGLTPDAPEGLRRLRFADWLSAPENPLPWRVIVNRVWQWHFGRGIVGTPSDFGFNGERPTHPELLDWLAREFLVGGQSIKQLHRLILTSAAYRQSSRFDAGAAKVDADNQFLWRFPPHRLEAEAIRDSMLFVAGRLNEQMGGPSYRPFRLTVFNSNFYDLLEDGGPELARRTVYRMNVQSARDPLLESLDCPDPSTRTPRRAQTTTPIQSLGLMNGIFVQRQAHALAERVQREVGDDPARQVEQLYRLTFGRAPRPEEAANASELIRAHGTRALCWVMLNASEFVYVR